MSALADREGLSSHSALAKIRIKNPDLLSGRRDHEADLILTYSIGTNMYILHVYMLFVISLKNIKK